MKGPWRGGAVYNRKVKMIDWIPVSDSTRITAMAYEAGTARIFVRFPEDVEWWYGDCSELIWEQFQFASSKGQFIREELDHHPNGRFV